MPATLPPSFPGVRIGDTWFRIADQAYADTGLRGMRRPWRSLFPDRQNVSGGPGIQNVRADDLRWLVNSFALGGGQAVIDPSDPDSFRRYDSSKGVDLSSPGQIELAKAMVQQGLTGGSTTTVEGSAFTDAVGTSTVVNTTDRNLTEVNDIVATDVTLATGTSQLDLYAYLEGPMLLIPGDSFSEITAPTGVEPDGSGEYRLKAVGAMIGSGNLILGAGSVHVSVSFHRGNLFADGHDTIRVSIVDKTTDDVVASVDATARHVDIPIGGGGGGSGSPGASGSATATLTFTAQATHAYRVRVKYQEDSASSTYIDVSEVELDVGGAHTLGWELLDGSTVQAAGTVEMSGVDATQRVASVTQQNAAGPHVYTFRVKHLAGGSRGPIVDKLQFAPIGLHDPRLLGLGQADRIWLVDYDSGPGLPALLFWKPDLLQWTSVATFGASGSKAVALAYSDHYEFMGMDDKKVYRGTTSAVAQLTAATADQLVGLAYGGNRLFILTESVGNGSELFEVDQEGVPNVTPTSRYPVGNKGVTVDQDIPQRMAGTKNGVVFFANQGPDCWTYAWDGAAGTPLQKLPTGFRGRSIVHGSGLSWIGGAFPAIDSTGATRYRPAVFGIIGTDSGAPVEQLDVKLYDDADPGTHIQAMQLYGSDLWVLTQVEGSPKKGRLWRISLRGTPAAFLYQEVVTGYDPGTSQQGALAVRQVGAAGNVGTTQSKIAAGWTLADVANLLASPTLIDTYTEVVTGVANAIPQGWAKRSGQSAGLVTSDRRVDPDDLAYAFTITADSTITPVSLASTAILEASEAGLYLDFDDVTPGDPFVFSCDMRVKSGSTGGAAVRVGIYALDAANNRLTETMGGWQTGTSFTRQTAMIPSLPAGTVRVRVSLRAAFSQVPVSPATFQATAQFRNAKLARSSTDSTYVPPSTQAGSTLLAILSARYSGGIAFTPPAGWTLDGARVDNTNGISTAVYKIEGAAVRNGIEVFTLDTTRDATLTLMEIEGTASASVVDKTATATGSSTTPSSGTTALTTQATEIEVAVLAVQRDIVQAAPITPGWTQEPLYVAPNGSTIRYNIASGNPTAASAVSHALYTRVTAAAEAAAVSASIPAVRQWAGKVVTLKAPAVAVAPIPNAARGLAVTWKDRILAWSNGSPYREAATFTTSGENIWTSSRYSFGLTEEKLLMTLELDADLPEGTSVDLFYATDDSEFVSAGQFTQPDHVRISRPNAPVRFRNLRLRAFLHTTDQDVTPTLYSVMAGVISQEYDQAWELLLDCRDENAVYHISGEQRRGSVGVAAIFALAAEGGVVEFEDRYSSKETDDAVVYAVTVETPDASYLGRGEALVHVRLTQWE